MPDDAHDRFVRLVAAVMDTYSPEGQRRYWERWFKADPAARDVMTRGLIQYRETEPK